MQNIGIFYGSSTGNTEDAAKQIQKALGADTAQIFDVTKANSRDLKQFNNIILGASTWGLGNIQNDFEDFISEIDSINLKGKKVAIFGFGDQDTYADTFVDAIGQIYDATIKNGCEIVGKIAIDNYEYDESRAEIDGQFVGLALDEENQSDLTTPRIEKWINQLKNEFI
ncbi:MAG: flavodoxin [Bacteroidetes bacterium 4572_77]|nr:MAG: flavodoxin [Bacteroidetes bacterium 4572_77]